MFDLRTWALSLERNPSALPEAMQAMMRKFQEASGQAAKQESGKQ